MLASKEDLGGHLEPRDLLCHDWETRTQAGETQHQNCGLFVSTSAISYSSCPVFLSDRVQKLRSRTETDDVQSQVVLSHLPITPTHWLRHFLGHLGLGHTVLVAEHKRECREGNKGEKKPSSDCNRY